MKEYKELRIAIIGCGMISHRHMTVIENLNKRGYNLRVVAAAEIDKEKLEKWGKQYGVAEENLYQNFREMLKRDDIDEVEVCVHNNLHTSVATAVMAAGYDCYSEKPMAASYADAKILYDAQKKYGKKLAVQISSIYNPQTRIAKKMIEEGKLGKVYHVRSVGHRRQGRPGYDMPFFSPDFINPKVGVHGPLFDLGIYHLAQMLYVLGMPELESVYGMQSCDYWTDERIDKITNRTAPVEDLGVGMARFKGGISMDIYEDWAMHIDDVGPSFVAGSMGGLKLIDVDTTGGELAVPKGGVIVGDNLTVDGAGKINAPAPYTLPAATADTIGGVKPGTNMTVGADGTLTGNYLPLTGGEVNGNVEVGALQGSNYFVIRGGGNGAKFSYNGTNVLTIEELI